MFGINGAEFVLLLLVAVLVIGPERLPGYAEQLAGWVRTLRRFLSTAKERVATELGEEAADVDWASLDPRRYDPRRIVREALLDDPAPAAVRAGGPAAASAVAARVGAGPAGDAAADGPVPFDDEAT